MPVGTLIIAEKPSQAQEYARVLGAASRGDGFITLKDGGRVTWAVGHLLEYLSPDELNEAWKGYWSWNQVPMIPDTIKQKPVKRTAAQFKIIKELLKSTTNVVVATDAGREGEMIAREILDYCKYKGRIQRLWPQSMMESDLRYAFANLIPGEAKEPLYQAAKARGTSDWLVGYNCSRGATLAAKVRGDYFPVGRVQTPVLYMVCKRERDILNFTAKTYYELEAEVRAPSGAMFKMKHAPRDDARIYDKAVATTLLNKAKGFVGPIRVQKTSEKESPPLPFSLPTLQKESDRLFGLSATDTLAHAQLLYEAKLITYPRSDYTHLASKTKEKVPSILEGLAGYVPAAISQLRASGVTMRNSTFDDSKVGDHDGIIPTGLQPSAFSGKTLDVYRLIVQRFIQTLAPDMLYDQTRLSCDANTVPFTATGRAITSPGFTAFKLLKDSDE